MTGITDPSEEYFKDGLWGWATNTWEKLISSGGSLVTALHGWDGSVWRKLPLVFGFSNILAFRTSAVISGANGYIYSAAVPAGEIWVVTNIGVADIVTATTRNRIAIRHSGTNLAIADVVDAFGIALYATWSGHAYLGYQDLIRADFAGGLAGDVCYIDVIGYKMLIAE